MLSDALRAPKSSDHWVSAALVGGVLMLLATAALPMWIALVVAFPVALLAAPLFALPVLVLRGYYLRVVAAGLARERGTPPFVRWGGLVRDGAKTYLLSAAYLSPLLLLAVVVAVGVYAVRTAGVRVSFAAELVIGVLAAAVGVVTVGYLLAYAYVRPAALAAFAREGNLRDALDVRRVARTAADSSYAKGWLLAVGVTLTAALLAAPLSALLVGFFLFFYARTAAHVLYGRGASPTLGPDRPFTAESEPTTAGTWSESTRSEKGRAEGARIEEGRAEEDRRFVWQNQVANVPGSDPVEELSAEDLGGRNELPRLSADEAPADVQVGKSVPLRRSESESDTASEPENGGDGEAVREPDAAAGDSFDWGDADGATR